MYKRIIFIGPYSKGRIPTDGAAIKNCHILNRLHKLIPSLVKIDTDGWKKRPWLLVRILMMVVCNSRSKYILSLNNDSANKLIRIIHKIAPQASVIYWVIGGSIGKWLCEKRVNANDYKWLTNIIVEGDSMKRQMETVGLRNVTTMPNFKSLVSIEKSHNVCSSILKLVFLSRINPEKGCNLILDAADILNKRGYSGNYTIDFYGSIEPHYKKIFISRINALQNVRYQGFLDLRICSNYNKLANYDAMLFPTYWHGEGCPGVVIDAYMCGLPILASDWNLNRDYIVDNKTGVLFEPSQ